MNKALFLDLDGTLIKTKSGNTFPKDIDDWEFKDYMLPLIKKFRDEGYNICIVSNQGGIELGYITQEQFERKMKKIEEELEQYIGGGVNHHYCGNTRSYFRKPLPGMAYQLAIALELSLRESIMVGDMESDAKFAKNAYIGTYYDVDDFIHTFQNT